MPCPPDPLIAPAQLSRYNVPSDFLAQFLPRPFLLQIAAAGALGAMQFQWMYPGDADWSVLIVSTAGASWTDSIDKTFTDLSFAAATYGQGDTYMVDALGSVIPQAGAQSGLISATRYDQRAITCSAVTQEALTLMGNAVKQPLLTWGDDARMHAAAWVYEWLKYGKGLAPDLAAVGDANIINGADRARKYFATIGEKGRPESMTDSSPSADGPMMRYPTSDKPRGW